MTKSVLGRILVGLIICSAIPLSAVAAAGGSSNPFCGRLGKTIQASTGARMYCFGPQAVSPRAAINLKPRPLVFSLTPNVDAANFAEDITPAGVRAYGQSETSIAAIDPYVVEAWNDSMVFFTNCGAPNFKEEGTGFGFSSNSGASFTDLGGLPNNGCLTHRLFGDPSVAAYKTAQGDFFYIASLYPTQSVSAAEAPNYLAVNACRVIPVVGGARLACGQPIRMAQSTQCIAVKGLTFCSFLDKEFLTVDAKRGRLYVSYADFPQTPTGFGSPNIEVAVCDIGSLTGAPGPAGGTAANPVCPQGKAVSNFPKAPPPKPYLVLASNSTCENEGAYPDVDKTTGNLYVAWEFNWNTNFAVSPCFGFRTADDLALVNAHCLTLTPISPCTGPQHEIAMPITSMDTAFIPGYNRFPMNDFPRIAVSEFYGTVSIVWNDARINPDGDIFLQSFRLNSLAPVQSTPTKISTNPFAIYAFLPALRNENGTGKLNISWYDRRRSTTGAGTDVFIVRDLSPLATTTVTNQPVTNATSDWLTANSDIIPNFGDYTDNFVTYDAASPTQSAHRVYISWSDGRYSDPQPFEANVP